MHSRHRLASTATLLAGLLLIACGPSPDEGGSADAAPEQPPVPSPISITIEPVDQELVIDGSTPATSAYTATGEFEDGHSEDVTDRATFSVSDSRLGSFSANDFTSTTDRGGRAVVTAAIGSVRADTGLTLKLRQRHDDPASDLPDDPEGLFDGPDEPARAPAIVYPNDGILVPPNMKLLEIHFNPGAGNTLFELSFQNDLTDVKVYARCTAPLNGGCIYTPDAALWEWLSETSRGGAELVVQARGTDDAGAGVGTSSTIRLAFSFEDVRGGIYYWKAAVQGETAVMRYDFGNAQQLVAEPFVGPAQADGKCVGCHALSRDGSKMVAAAGGWDVEDILLLDVETATRVGSPGKSAFASWNPDGSQYVGVFGYEGTTSYDLLLFDGATGGSLGVIDVGATEAQSTTHPDWSADGSRIVYTRAGMAYENGANNQRFYRGSIHMVENTGGVWGAPVELVPPQGGTNQYYPSFSPDGALVAFNRSQCPSGQAHIDCNADSDPTATIYVTRPEPGATPIALTRANAQGPTDAGAALTNSWPKWAPFEFQRTAEEGTRLVWMTFSSTRNYGLRTPPAGTSDEASSGTLLWMVAIDPDRAAAGEDPSYPAFCLPFQDLSSSNHIAQWTEQVVDVD